MFAEFAIINHLQYRAYKNQDYFKSITQNLSQNFKFEKYQSVWSYKAAPIHKSDIQIDIFAKSAGSYSIIGEVKNRKNTKVSKEKVTRFENKANELMTLEKIESSVLFIFSLSGFTKEALEYMQSSQIAFSQDKRWLKK